MKKKLSLMGLLIFWIGYSGISQTYLIQVRPLGSKVYGYANLKGEIIIDAKFRKCTDFSEDGFAAIYDSDKKQFYFINQKGESLATEVSNFKLKDILGFGFRSFIDGMAAIKQGDKWGFLNTSGKVAVPVKYDDISPFDGGYSTAQSLGKFYIIDKQGKETAVEVPGLVDLRTFSEKLAPFKTADGKFGFVGENGKVAIEAKYLSVGYFSDGLAWAKNTDEKIGYINSKGEWIIQPQFSNAKDFDAESGMARIKTADKWAYVNKKGEIINVNDTDLWGDFSNGLAKGRRSELVGFFNSKGEWVIQPQFDAVRDFKNGYAAAKKADKWGLIDKKGSWVIQPSFDDISDMIILK
jgi:hypothetical protein